MAIQLKRISRLDSSSDVYDDGVYLGKIFRLNPKTWGWRSVFGTTGSASTRKQAVQELSKQTG